MTSKQKQQWLPSVSPIEGQYSTNERMPFCCKRLSFVFRGNHASGQVGSSRQRTHPQQMSKFIKIDFKARANTNASKSKERTIMMTKNTADANSICSRQISLRNIPGRFLTIFSFCLTVKSLQKQFPLSEWLIEKLAAT